MAKKTTKEAEIEAAAKEEVKAELQQAQEEAAAGAEDPAEDEAQDVENFEVKKGDTVHLKAVMPIYDKIGGDQIGTAYKYNALIVEEVKAQNDRVYIKTEAGYIVAKDEANVYIM